MRLSVFKNLILPYQALFGMTWALSCAFLPSFSPIYSYAESVKSFTLWMALFAGYFLARTAGMSFNRLIDRQIDAKNPRTQDRALPKGVVSPGEVKLLSLLCSLGFVVDCMFINQECLALSPLVVFLLWAYSYTKRFTYLSHFVLGLIQFLAPVFAWSAVSGRIDPPALWLGLSLLLSIAANDVVYALQDMEFDRRAGLKSIPAILGQAKSLWIARALHVGTLGCLVCTGVSLGASFVFFIGTAVIAVGLMIYHLRISRVAPWDIMPYFVICNSALGSAVLTLTLACFVWNKLS